MIKTIPAYIALLHADGSEPVRESGYQRAFVGDVALCDVPHILQADQIAFPDVVAPGYGDIASAAMFTMPEGGDPMWVWKFPETLDVHEGVTPVIHKGKLYRGVAVSARVIMQTDGSCNI